MHLIQKATSLLLWVLSLTIFIVLVLSVLIIINIEPSWLNIPDTTNRVTLVSSIPISSGVLIAILTFLRERRKQEQENERNRAKFYLELAERGFEEVYELLKDKNNNRITWVRAARVLLKTRSLKTQVDAEDFNRAFLQLEERVRNELYRALTIGGENGERASLPPQFYYGIDDWASSITLDEAAIKSSSKINAYAVLIDTVPPEPSLKPLAEKSIIAIYDFLEYPKDYEDPLVEIEIWKGNWANSWGVSQGARRYVAHQEENYTINGKLHKRSEANKQG